MFFFFFKQKTAYELRISDWSSDVSSSDLRAAAARASLPRCRDMPRSFALRIARRRPLAHDEAGLHDGDDRCALVLRDLPGYRDRQSVVSGKRLSVRVDLGGRRFCKKKINKTTQRNQ